MDAIEMLKTRCSCRSFKEEQIKDEELNTIIDCGLNAPSGMNQQSTIIVVIQDKELLTKMAELNDKIWQKGKDPFYGAPTLTIVFAKKDSSNNVKDGSLVIGAMQDGAFALNIGSCWINRAKEMFEDDQGQEYLNQWGLEGYQGVGCCILGYPNQANPKKIIKENRVIKVK